jgi:hypothetical protein
MKNSTVLGIAAAGLVAGLALGSLGIAYGANSTASKTTTPSVATTATMGQRGPDGHGRGVIGKPGFGGEGDIAEALASLSGLTVDEVNVKRQAGTSYAAIAKAEGVSTSALIAETVKIETEECDAAVKAGTITSAERTAVLKDIETRLKTAIASTDAMGGPGGRGGHRGPGGPHGSAAPTSTPSATQ